METWPDIPDPTRRLSIWSDWGNELFHNGRAGAADFGPPHYTYSDGLDDLICLYPIVVTFKLAVFSILGPMQKSGREKALPNRNTRVKKEAKTSDDIWVFSHHLQVEISAACLNQQTE
jgi:hypothetical protein